MRAMRSFLAEARQRVSARVPGLVRRLAAETVDDRIAQVAAATAFFGVLSIFPTLLLLTGLIGVVDAVAQEDVTSQVRDRVTTTLEAVLTDQASSVVESVSSFLEGGNGGLLTVAAVAALLSVSGAWAAVVGALNQAYDTGEDRPWLRRRLVGLGLGAATLLVVALTAALLVAGPLLGRGQQVADLVGLGPLFVASWTYLRWPLVALGVMAWLSVVYRYAPNRRSPWRAGFPGAVATTASWLLATAGFHLYLRVAGESSPVLGAFGGGAIVMLWAYLLTFALLMGGELNAVLQERRAESSEAESTSRPTDADPDSSTRVAGG